MATVAGSRRVPLWDREDVQAAENSPRFLQRGGDGGTPPPPGAAPAAEELGIAGEHVLRQRVGQMIPQPAAGADEVFHDLRQLLGHAPEIHPPPGRHQHRQDLRRVPAPQAGTLRGVSARWRSAIIWHSSMTAMSQ